MNNIKLLLFTFAITAIVASCGERELDIYDGPNQIHFIGSSGDYFVQEANDPGFEIEVGSLRPSDGNLTATILVNDSLSTAVEGTHYTLSSSTKTIGDGEVLASVTVQGIFENLDSAVTLVLNLEESESVANFNKTFTLTLTQFCPYVQDEFVGTYTFNSTAFGATYDVEIVAGPTSDVVIAQNLYEDGFNIAIELDDSDQGNFVASVEKQDAWISAQYGQARVEGGGSFNACEKTITLDLEHTVDAGSFGSFREVLTKN